MIKSKVEASFIYSACIILMFTGIAKVVSSAGKAAILQLPDPVLSLPFYYLLCVAGFFELFVAAICFFSKHKWLKSCLVAWIATIILFYRLGLILVNYAQPCPCLGNLTDALHISPHAADTAMKIVLAYLLIGSYTTLFWLWRQKRKQLTSSAVGAVSL